MDVHELGISAFPTIVLICYVAGMIARASKVPNKWIPCVCAISGAVLGVVGLLTVDSFPATDYLSAVAVGTISGLAATGVNQVFVQYKKDVEEDSE